MKRLLLGLALVAVAGAGAAFALGLVKINRGADAGTCREDGEIASAKRTAIESASLAFARIALSNKPSDAYPLMTKEARNGGSAEKFATDMGAISRMGPFSSASLARTYLIDSVGSGPDAREICGLLTNNQWVSVAIKPGLEQAHVVLTADTRNNGWAITLWLLPEDGTWRIQYFHIGAANIVGRTPEMLLDLARKERDAGHAFNANMLYAGVQATIDRGPAFQLGIEQPFREDIAKFQMPPELRGKPPFTWTLSGKQYAVAQVSIIGIGKDIGLMFILPNADWPGDSNIDKRNREFISAFIAGHADYSRVFTFLVARGMKPDSSGGFGTVYENGKGFGD